MQCSPLLCSATLCLLQICGSAAKGGPPHRSVSGGCGRTTVDFDYMSDDDIRGADVDVLVRGGVSHRCVCLACLGCVEYFNIRIDISHDLMVWLLYTVQHFIPPCIKIMLVDVSVTLRKMEPF